MTSNAKEYDVFLSYSAQDRPWVTEFARALQLAGVRPWFDLDALAPGLDWSETLEHALRESETLIVFLSPDSVKNSNVLFEIGAAIGGHKRIIPVLLGEVDSREIPLQLAKREWIRAASPIEAGKQVAGIIEKNSRPDSEA